MDMTALAIATNPLICVDKFLLLVIIFQTEYF